MALHNPFALLGFSFVALCLGLAACGTRTDLADYGIYADASTADSSSPDASNDSSPDGLTDAKSDSVADSAKDAPVPPPNCGPSNCLGCCTIDGTCVVGNSNNDCGVGGTACQDCGAQNLSCVNSACHSTTTTCSPSPYAGCPSDLISVAPVTSLGSCSKDDLAAMEKFCNNDSSFVTCIQTLKQYSIDHPGCGKCAIQFATPRLQAICSAAFVDKSCNHTLTCGVDCLVTSCNSCPNSELDQCYQQTAESACPELTSGSDCAFQQPDNVTGKVCFAATSSGEIHSLFGGIFQYFCGDGTYH
jgi:hypothetical protein